MSKVEYMIVTLPADMAASIKRAVQAGEYASGSDLVQEAVQALTDKNGPPPPDRPAGDPGGPDTTDVAAGT